MNHFLVRLGKSKYSQLFMPALNCTIVSIYAGVQFGIHDQLRDLFAAQTPSRRRERISTHLRDLITETHDTCSNNGYNEQLPEYDFFRSAKCQIKWFVSSTLEPITFGCTSFTSGILVGLPKYYNYTKPDDIPDSTFEIRKLALFRSPQDKQQEEQAKAKSEGLLLDGGDQNSSILLVRKFERDSAEGEAYARSLLLSEDAKRFSIARELYLADTNRTIFRVGVLFMSCTLALSAARASVAKLNLKQAHITQRLCFYLLSGALGWGNNHFLSMAIDQTYAQAADNKAKQLGESYTAGAEEYYEKRARRNEILGIR